MSKSQFNVMLDVTVFDQIALYGAALTHALATGSTESESIDLLKPEGEIDVSACLIMLLDPGVSPSGIQIESCTVESY